MGKVARALAVFLCLLSGVWVIAQKVTVRDRPTSAVGPQAVILPAVIVPAIMPLDQIHEGMKGTALTVFQGVKPESMDVEVLGVMRNVNGPKGDIILVRLHGTKPEYTGVVAGMSGSPVYFDGKLAGALAFRIGEFSKEPIAGVTPIEEMLEINALDHSSARSSARGSARDRAQSPASASLRASSPDTTSPNQGGATQTASPGEAAALPTQSYSNYLTPIETPLVFNGFSDETLQRYASQFAAAGIVPVMGIGSASDRKQPEPIEAGSAVSAVLVRGDMDIAATCTVTYVDPERLLACGHPLLQFGEVDLPMTKATVLATLPSPLNAFKIVNTTETVGAFVQDRQNGIMGVPGRESKMIPVTVAMHSVGERGTATKEFHYEILNNARLSPLAMMATVFNALHGTNQYGEDITYRMNGVLSVKGYPEVTLRNMFAPQDNGQPAAALAAASIGERFGRIYSNPFDAPDVQGVRLDFDLVRERRSARLEAARTDMTEARPGDQIMVETVIRPYRGERLVRQIPIRIPTSTARGTLRILVSDGDTLDRMHRGTPMMNRGLGLAPTIALLNKERANDRVYVSLIGSDPEAMVADKVMPTLPLSVMNVMENMRGTQDMVVLGESSVSEASTDPLDYVVSGAQMLTINIK